MPLQHEADVYDRAADVHVRLLQLKPEADNARPVLIVTERGARYQLASEVKTLH